MFDHLQFKVDFLKSFLVLKIMESRLEERGSPDQQDAKRYVILQRGPGRHLSGRTGRW